MRNVLVVVLLLGCAPAPPEAQRQALGEPTDGFPTWSERVVHVWTNRARQDPAADLAACPGTNCAEASCYSARPPLVWSHALARAARFHSDNLTEAGCSLQHDSPCTLVADLDARYTPGTCDGDPSCACQGGSAACGSSGTSFGDRVRLFGVGPRAENIATGSEPVSTFYRWLHERDGSTACGWRIANGHRANILGDSRSLGVGRTVGGNVWTQDFGSSGTPDGIVAGVHTPQTGSAVELRANWYRGAAPTSLRVNVDGDCTPMTLERGTAANGTYLASVSGLSGCARYVFEHDDGGATVRFPTTGSYGIGCPEDHVGASPPSCGCAPSCGGRACGDDGCGGSCGGCGAGQTCDASGACVCGGGLTDCGGSCVDTSTSAAHCGACGNACGSGASCVSETCVSDCTPSCGGRACGGDGCGGSCGSCSGGRVCDGAGQCACGGGRTDCGGTCVDTDVDPAHCGACANACGASEGCVDGACACVPSCDGRTCGGDGCGGSCGSCGSGRLCADGACACAGSGTDCGGSCVDLRIDPAHCGACDVGCDADEVCRARACVSDVLDAGACEPDCEGRACGDDTCGGVCGDCASDRVCAGGACLCPEEATACGGACVDLRSDDAHCGACDAACGAEQRCVAGSCAGGAPDAGAADAGARDAGAGIDGGDERTQTLRGVVGCGIAPGRVRSGPFALLLLIALAWRRSPRAR